MSKARRARLRSCPIIADIDHDAVTLPADAQSLGTARTRLARSLGSAGACARLCCNSLGPCSSRQSSWIGSRPMVGVATAAAVAAACSFRRSSIASHVWLPVLLCRLPGARDLCLSGGGGGAEGSRRGAGALERGVYVAVGLQTALEPALPSVQRAHLFSSSLADEQVEGFDPESISVFSTRNQTSK